MSFSVVSALLRLGHKYDIPHLRDNSLDRLRKEYAPSDYKSLNLGDFIYLVHHTGIAFDVVNLFNDERIISALPLALYEVIAHNTTVRVYLSSALLLAHPILMHTPNFK